MSERKVLNKYYPPDFDPTKIPRMRMPKNRKFCVRLMAPCNMRCDTCGEYIYKGKKFNARKEDVDDLSYLGIRIYRFYIKCTRCLSEISFRTDPEATDYVLEAGATRNFQALKLAEEAAEREEAARLEEEKNNPMKLLEKRTQQSKYEMDMLETLEELKELNQRQGSTLEESLDQMLRRKAKEAAVNLESAEAEDEAFIQSVFGSRDGGGKRVIRRLEDSEESDEEIRVAPTKPAKVVKTDDSAVPSSSALPVASGSGSRGPKEAKAWEKSLGSLGGASSKKLLVRGALVKPKVEAPKPAVKEEPADNDDQVAGVLVSPQPPSSVSTAGVAKTEAESVAVPVVVAASFEKGLAAGASSSLSSSSSVSGAGSAANGVLRGGFYNPFGAYGSGSSDSDSD